MAWRSKLLFLCVLLIITFPLTAQDGDGERDIITDTSINYGDTVNDTITELSIFDFYRFRASAGDRVFVQMIASDGLAPLLGISGAGREIIARSDEDVDGNRLPDAEPNTTVELEFIIPEDGEYAVVPTRVGNDQGTTTGSYTLIFRLVNPSFIEEDTTQDVTFRCSALIGVTATTFGFAPDSAEDEIRVSVYGFDGFAPVIRAVAGATGDLQDCGNDSQAMAGDAFILPDGEIGTVAEGEIHANAAQLTLRGDSLRQVQFTIGAVEGTSGRYMVILEGLQFTEAQEEDNLNLRLGPLATSTEMLAYMVKAAQNRIDPLMTLIADGDNENVTCDDAGRGDCEAVPAMTDAGVIFNDGLSILGDRFSAGLSLAPGNQDVMFLQFSSRARSATGSYAIILIGELPARSEID